jgi:acyl-CoA dehydrogenase
MKILLAIAAVPLTMWALAFFRARLIIWTALIAIFLAAGTYLSSPAYGPWLFIWPLFIAAAALLNVTRLRLLLVTGPLSALFRRKLPPISRTEREALEAGTVWWDGELFSGRPDWDRLLSLPEPRLNAEEEAFLSGEVDELCRMLDDWRITEELRDLPSEVWRFIREKGFFAMIIPREYGGLGFSASAQSRVIMKIASRSYAAAVTVMVPNSLGPAELLLRYGSEAQKNHYLPRLARGEEVPCFALTSPEAGSDAAAIPDTGVVCRGLFNGEECIGVRLNWDKRYITLGPVATLIGLAFRLYDPEHLLGETDDVGITLAMVPADLPGIEIGSRHDPLGIPFQNGPNRGREVFVPLDRIVGEKEGAGQGWRMLMECLATGRSISLPALSTGQAKFAARAVGAYARVRRQFRLPIGHFEGIKEALARIAGYSYLMESARAMTCAALERGESPSVVSAIVKYHTTEMMRRVANDAMDVMGGRGISLGPRNLVARFLRGAPIGITVEGANILTRSMIIFGQGLVRCHPFLKKEMEAVADPDRTRGVKEFDLLLREHCRYVLANAARAIYLGLSRGYPLRGESGILSRYVRSANRFSAGFSLAVDLALLTMGGSLKRRESISGRLADILGHLYLLSAVIRRFDGEGRPGDALPLARWCCEESLERVREGFAGIMKNLPFRPAAWLLRLCVFPLGRPLGGADDALTLQVADILLGPSPARERLSSGIFLPSGADEPLGQLEDALLKVIAAEPVEQRMRDAVREGRLVRGTELEMLEAGVQAGIIGEEEARSVWSASQARKEAIRVDDFPSLGKDNN